MSEQWLSIVEYARTFAVSDMTIRRRIKTGRIEAVLRDGKYYIQVGQDKAGNPMRLDVRSEKPTRRPEPSNESFATELTAQTLAHKRESDMRHSYEMPQKPVQQPAVVGHRVKTAPAPIAHQTVRQPAHQNADWELESTAPLAPTTPGPYESGLLPSHIRHGIQESATSMVESKALLDFCESVLRRFSRLEARLEEGFKTKMTLIENQMQVKEQENNKLRQQIEDLQLLIKILEKGPPPSRG